MGATTRAAVEHHVGEDARPAAERHVELRRAGLGAHAAGETPDEAVALYGHQGEERGVELADAHEALEDHQHDVVDVAPLDDRARDVRDGL